MPRLDNISVIQPRHFCFVNKYSVVSNLRASSTMRFKNLSEQVSRCQTKTHFMIFDYTNLQGNSTPLTHEK